MATTTTTTTTSFFSLLAAVLLYTTSITSFTAAVVEPDPYFSKTTLFSDFEKMTSNLKIFMYPTTRNSPRNVNNNANNNFSDTLPPPLALFYTSLITSGFLTRDPTQATLFFLPFPPQSTRSLARHIENIRTTYPYWDRSLGADHFYLTCYGVGPTSSRNVVELLKNAVQVSCFPSPAREFVPHKDVTLPPYFSTTLAPRAGLDTVKSTRFLGYWRFDQVWPGAEQLSALKKDVDFLIESEPSDESVYVENMRNSKFCLFGYDDVEGMRGLGVALAQGCVPVVITDRPIQDFPLMDVIRWSEIALFVRSSVGPDELKRMLIRTCEEVGVYETMRRLGVAAAHHLVWSGEPYDAFHMVVYQLWLKRHAIRYARWEAESM